MNVPYVREYNEVGEWINQVKGNYLHSEPNRQERRSEFKKQRPNNLRKRTLGRVIQTVDIKVLDTVDKTIVKKNHLGETVSTKIKKVRIVDSIAPKQIRHETNDALSRKIAMFNFFSMLELLKTKWHKAHPEYQKKG